MTAPVAISLTGLSKVFPGSASPAVRGLDLDVPAGAIVALVGPSGCGKTTTLKMINRLIEPTSGRIELGGRDVTTMPAHDLRRGIGYVIQQIGLFPHRTIEANIGTVPRLLGWDRAAVRDRVRELADVVGLDPDMLRRYPPELSGGQQQRVGVARALAADPPVLLMDEPYSAVDPIVRGRLQDELLALQAELNKTIVLVSHDIDEAIKLGDLVCVLDVGGVIEQYAPPEELLRAPSSTFVERFLGADRGLRRLGLLRVGDVDLDQGPVVASTDAPAVAHEVMAERRTDWVGVLDGDRLLGWVPSADLNGQASMAELGLQPFRAVIGPGDNLRAALDGIVGSRTSVAVVEDAERRYLGMVSIAAIGRRSGE